MTPAARVLVLTPRLPATEDHGGARCTMRLVRLLAAGGARVHLIGRGVAAPADPGWPPGVSVASIGPVSPAFDELPLPARLRTLSAALWKCRGWTTERVAGGVAPAALHRALGGFAPDLCVLDHAHAAPWRERVAPCVPLLLHLHNLDPEDQRRRATSARGIARRLLEREAKRLAAERSALLRVAAAVAALSADDAGALAVAARAAGRAQLPIGVLTGWDDTGAAVEASLDMPHRGAPRSRRLGVIGTWTWAPNRASLEWLLHELHPRLPAGCELHIAGRGPAPPPRPGAPIVWHGPVADDRAFLGALDMLLLPPQHGSGVLEKAVLALASGQPVVAARSALRGLAPWPPAVRVADDAATFAAACAEPPAADAAGAAAWNAQRRHRAAASLGALLAAAAATCGGSG
jgi:hypothetical protein